MSDERRCPDPLPITRRKLLRGGAIGGVLAGLPTRSRSRPQSGGGTVEMPDRERLVALAHALLPSELTVAERAGVADALLSWLRGYRAGETMDHGYGFTRIRETDADPGPRYALDLDEMEETGRRRWSESLATLDRERLRQLAAEAIDSHAPDRDSIPSRPDAPHVTIALLSAYYRSAAAADRAYEARIGRETCRGLFTDVEELRPWAPAVEDADREARR